MPVPLDKCLCTICGAIRRRPVHDNENPFDANYALYAHDPGGAEETRRQSAYGAWLAEAVDAPASCFEAGSGNGSLLLALRECWKGTALAGVEPAPGAAAAARRAGLDVTTGFLEEADAREPRAALALSINVIEHTPDPRAFLRALASHGDRVAVVCPDGSVPNSELLFGDHLHSFHAEHLAAFAHAEGLRVDAIERAPARLGYFQMILASHTTIASPAPALHPPDGAPQAYLSSWRSLDAALIARINGARVAAFGAGEAAGLLRAYAPQAWSQVAMCAVDAPDIEHFGDLAVVDARTLEPGPILLAVRPGVQQALGERLAARGHWVVRWDDVIAR